MRALAIALVATIALPAAVDAQCAFNRPSGSTANTATLTSSLVRAFVSCNNPGGATPNATTIGGVPSCQPVENFHQQGGSPLNGWEFADGTSYGKVTLKRAAGGLNPGNSPPPTLRDAAITVKLYHIARTNGGGFANGTGSALVVLRATTDDYGFGGDMTIIDFPFSIPIQLSNGSASVTKKIGDVLFGIGQPRFSDCTSLEFVSVAVRDPNGNIFAVPGVRY